MNTLTKTLFVVIAALVIGALGAGFASATPYDGVNRIGTIYQYNAVGEYSYSYSTGSTRYYDAFAGDRHAYGYIAAPRAGGFFGSDRSNLIGLRRGVYYPLGPVGYTVYAEPTCPWPYCHLGGTGYQRPTYSTYSIRNRIGGIHGY